MATTSHSLIHPGSGGSLGVGPKFECLFEVAPRAVVVSAGAGNRFGLPHAEALERFEATGATLLRTDQHGAITLHLGPEGLELEPHLPGPRLRLSLP